jgi:carboxyl-terminal processing protease
MILDLRGNPGGLLDTAIDIMGEFIPEGPLMVERWGDGREVVYQSDGSHLAAEIPLVVLVDEGSASASEVLAAAVQARERGTIVGEQTFGKGTVQNWHQLSDGGGLRVTIARWLSPDGEWVDGNGVRPDVVVEWSGPRPKEPGEDVQLNAAIDVLRGQTLWPTWPLPWLDALPSGVAG